MRISRKESSGLFTPSEVAMILTISASHVRKCCDSGMFPGTHKIGKSKDRRIPATSVVAFCVSQNIPIPEELKRIETIFLARSHQNPTVIQ